MDYGSPAALLASIQGLSYIIIFCVFLLEGPVLNYIAGFASSLGLFNIFLIYIIAICANIAGDVIYYLIGSVGKKAFSDKFTKKALSSDRIMRIKKYLNDNPAKTIFVIKMTPIFAGPGLIIAGAAHMPIKRYMIYSVVYSIVQCTIMVFLGYYSGRLFEILYKYVQYGTYLAAGLIIIIIALWFLFKALWNKYYVKIEKI